MDSIYGIKREKIEVDQALSPMEPLEVKNILNCLLKNRLFSLTAMVFVSVGTVAAAEPIKVAWVELTRPWTLDLVEHYLAAPDSTPLTLGKPHSLSPDEEEESPFEGKDKAMMRLASRFYFSPLTPEQSATVLRTTVPVDPHSGLNPFALADKDFYVGDYLPWPLGTPAGPPPLLPTSAQSWFAEQVHLGAAPDVFVIGGHHVIGEGFHNSEETRFLFESSIFAAAEQSPDVRSYFDNVKIAILWGCNSLTDLEPHHADGSVMTADEIRSLYQSGEAGRRQVLGTKNIENSMEFYKARLAREYGPGTPEYAYTRDEKLEKCKGPGPYQECDVANLERILPDRGLFDGSHRYNEALKMNQLFRNAYLVLGFASASPSEEMRVLLLQEAVRIAQRDLNLKGQSVFQIILNPQTSTEDRRRAIEALRKAWEVTTFKMNRHRPSGSITPALPEIDGGFVMNQRQTKQPQLNARFR